VIGTVRRQSDLDQVDPTIAHAVALDQPDPAQAIRADAPAGVDRIIDVAFSDNADLDTAVAANNAVIAAVLSPDRYAQLVCADRRAATATCAPPTRGR
jgi:NADPH2:quinone reductase